MDGEDHLVLADQGCRNTVFNAKAQSGAEYMHRFLLSGIRRFRVELVDEPPEYVGPLLRWYRDIAQASDESEGYSGGHGEHLQRPSESRGHFAAGVGGGAVADAGGGNNSRKEKKHNRRDQSERDEEQSSEGESSSSKRQQLIGAFWRWLESVPNKVCAAWVSLSLSLSLSLSFSLCLSLSRTRTNSLTPSSRSTTPSSSTFCFLFDLSLLAV